MKPSNQFNRYSLSCLFVILVFSGCIPEFPNNPYDPLSSNYIPTAPTAYAYPTSSTIIVVAWTNNSLGATGFQIERRNSQGDYSEIGRVAANDISFRDTSSSLVQKMTYYYRVRAFTPNTYSAYSNEASAALP
jgi:hypothetical protein